MDFKVYKLGNQANTVNMLKAIKNTSYINHLTLHNLVKSDDDELLFKFNIVFDKENKNVMSKEIWSKVHSAYISLEYHLLFIKNNDDRPNNLNTLIGDLLSHFDIEPVTFKINRAIIQELKNKGYKIHNIKYEKNGTIEYISSNFDKFLLDEKDNEILEVAFFSKEEDMIYFNNEATFSCGQEIKLYKYLSVFELATQ